MLYYMKQGFASPQYKFGYRKKEEKKEDKNKKDIKKLSYIEII